MAQDMTTGEIGRHLLTYAVPMILGNVMQLTYNAADSVIIGKFLGEDALAAVAAADPVMTIMILGASGLGIGSSVLISHFYGAGNHTMVRREFSTTVIFGFYFSLAVFVIGMIFSRAILLHLNMPASALDQAVLYLRIIMVGFLFTFQYNIISSSMRAIGDSRTPVRILSITCLMNIVLDYLLAVPLKMGVAGVALATVLAQAFSVFLCFRRIRQRIPVFRLTWGELKTDPVLLKKTLKSGSLTVLQQAAQPVGRLLIQGVINAGGTVMIGAFNAVCRMDDFGRIPAQSIGAGIMTATAQNRGAGKKDRVLECGRKGIMIAAIYFTIACTVFWFLKEPLSRLLCPDESLEMVKMSVDYMAVKAFIFIMPCMTNAVQGFYRGLGKMSVVLCATLIQITVRVICVLRWVPVYGMTAEAFACLTGWACMLVFEGIVWLVKGRQWINEY